LSALEIISNIIDEYSNIRPNLEPSAEQIVLAEILMLVTLADNTANISNKIKEDWQDEVKKDFNAYVGTRRLTLLAIRTPLPPTPGTSNTSGGAPVGIYSTGSKPPGTG
jgi:hypothetical protein